MSAHLRMLCPVFPKGTTTMSTPSKEDLYTPNTLSNIVDGATLLPLCVYAITHPKFIAFYN